MEYLLVFAEGGEGGAEACAEASAGSYRESICARFGSIFFCRLLFQSRTMNHEKNRGRGGK